MLVNCLLNACVVCLVTVLLLNVVLCLGRPLLPRPCMVFHSAFCVLFVVPLFV